MWTASLPSIRKALRFSRAWRSPSHTLQTSEVLIPVDGEMTPVQGTVVRPPGSGLRGWIVLHGVTRLGRLHPELDRFVRAVASTGAVVLVPEITEWTNLRFAPERSQTILRAAVSWMEASGDVRPGGVMLVGFSFGAPQALFAAGDPSLGGRILAVVSWGGYADIERTFRFSFTGEHEWEGVSYRERPDPYARWVIGGNCLPLSKSPSTRSDLVEALFQLASKAGERQIRSWDPSVDPIKEALRETLPPEDRELFDLFAPPTSREPDANQAEALIEELIPIVRRDLPLVEPLSRIDRIPCPVRLLHSRSDHLITFSETLRLGSSLESRVPDLSTRLTGLFSHSGEPEHGPPWRRMGDNYLLLRSLKSIFEVAGGDSGRHSSG
jgi:hypothetical protein